MSKHKIPYFLNPYAHLCNLISFITASRLLKHILNKAELDEHIGDVYLHVQVGNEDAKGFYLNHGFAEIDLIKGYYKKIEPADCYLLVKVLKQ